MNKGYYSICFAMMILLLAGLFLSFTSVAASDAKTVDVMFLHDIHSHLNEFTTVEESGEKNWEALPKL